MKTYSSILLIVICFLSFGQTNNFTEKEISVNSMIDGTLLLPSENEKSILVIIIGDYGPTDRNGNQNFQKNNSLKKLATALADKGIASFRYDKRIVKQIRRNAVDTKMNFNDFVTDAKSVTAYFEKQNVFSKIYTIGHGQGSLVAMLSVDENTDGIISIAGAGKNIGDVIYEQINATARQFAEDTKRVVSLLKAGKTTTDYPQPLSAMFNLETQPFMISWMAYNPTEVIKDLKLPILIINGTKDFQVPVEEAKLLAAANSKAQLRLIENMNHVLFSITGDNLENSKSYNEAFRPINDELISHITAFITNQ